MPLFEPSEAGGIENPNANLGNTSNINEAAELAPTTSHIYAWHWQDIRDPKYAFLRKFPGILGPVSTLIVVFRDEKSKGAGAKYGYGFADPDQGAAIVAAMRSSPHPYAEVFLPRVRKAGIPYTRF